MYPPVRPPVPHFMSNSTYRQADDHNNNNNNAATVADTPPPPSSEETTTETPTTPPENALQPAPTLLCSICLEPLLTTVENVQLECSHSFHGKCIATSFRYSPRCPMCRDDPVSDSHDQAERVYRQDLEQYSTLNARKKAVMNQPAMVQVVCRRADVQKRQKQLLAKWRQETAAHGKAFARMRRLQREKDKLEHAKKWCDARIQAELLRHDVPLHLRRPKRPSRPFHWRGNFTF
jgi:hypothetical protein